ncbi:metal ABC transporter substrate-binding protein [Sulfuriroseicoccus oceanibius]|uniref:Zinc ABC transporter substrate-binding protein n=1 Tax=Sulfuriroseicoccus oceanibius TaxID=2707525 RepID=A0A6B3LG71_9BACT|nr:metal ABC transporter substrate-binding protein [Sulfuriroseicoccus oceanibius]QQL45021.1 zinc ABC transporter substrate-binding protein [Sulfuriroseicoccus oceanibius]
MTNQPAQKRWATAWIGLVAMWLVGLVAAEPAMRVTALHPLMADLAGKVGGTRVEVIDLVGEDRNPHHLELRPSDMQMIQSSALVLAAGKGMETSLGALRDTLGADGPEVVEVGRKIPSLRVGDESIYACCPTHGAGGVDPHWWHSIGHTERAARIVAAAFGKVDPAGKAEYKKNAAKYAAELRQLKAWASKQLAVVPRDKRKLVTAHTAFGYFAKEFGFEVVAVQGLNPEQDATAKDLAAASKILREEGVAAVFPERGGRNKGVISLQRETGVKLGEPLIADGASSFVAMIRHNVEAIADGLGE